MFKLKEAILRHGSSSESGMGISTIFTKVTKSLSFPFISLEIERTEASLLLVVTDARLEVWLLKNLLIERFSFEHSVNIFLVINVLLECFLAQLRIRF